MPLARIITEVADDCLELTMQLRARGFQVETVAPGFIPSTPADLEVRMDECAPEDVVNYMAQSSAGDDLWVFVAPGALDSNSLPIRNAPVSIGLDPARFSPRKADAETRGPLRAVDQIAAVSPLDINAKNLRSTQQGKVGIPAVLGSLAIDAQEEDPILAELHEFPILGGSVASAPPIQPKEKAGVLTRLAAKASEKAEKVEEKRGVEKGDAKESTSASKTSDSARKAVTAKWLMAPEKVAVATSGRISIPIAPEPVRANIAVPVPKTVRKIKTPRVWNLQKLKVACSVAALAISAWFLVGTARLGDGAKPRALRPESVSSTQQPAPRTTTRPAEKSQLQSKTSTLPRAATAATKPKAAAVSTEKVRPHPTQGDGIIAQDTVTFYDRKPPSPRANVTQPEPGVKHHSDRD